jgi:chromosome segregation ATPase
MEMETNQTAKMVAWLDEERRKDKALITRLEERTASQTALIQDQARRIKELETDINRLRGNITPPSTYEEAISRLRNDVEADIEQIETRRTSVEQDLKRVRDMDRESIMKAVDELRQEVIGRIDRAMQPRRSEEERLSRVAVELQAYANNLSKGLEDFERSLTFLEEQRRQDTRRISDLNGEVAELGKRIDSQFPKVELLEELARRNERTITELSATLSEFKQLRQEWIEDQALADQQRERIINDMVRRMDSFAEEMLTYSQQVEGWADTHRKIKQQVEDFERIADRVDRRINEAAEVQRLSEERFRQEWEDFLGDDQKRWRQFTLTNEEAWRENEKALKDLTTQVVEVVERIERQSEHIKYYSSFYKQIMSVLADQLQTLQEQAEDGHSSLPALP